jgi:hypothetical protein
MTPARSEAARLDGWELAFDLPVGSGERAVANVRPHPTSAVHGVAYWIDTPQAEWLDRTEGVPAGAYRRIAVELVCGSGRCVAGFTYASSRGVEGRRPSPRYMGLILAGARHHGLPVTYVAWLESLELAVDERRSPKRRP